MDENELNTQLETTLSALKAKGASADEMQEVAMGLTNSFTLKQPTITNLQEDNNEDFYNLKTFASGTFDNAAQIQAKNQQPYLESLANGFVPVSADKALDARNTSPTEVIKNTLMNTAGDAWADVKGLISLPFHLGDFVNEVKKDPTFLLGPAGQQLVTGTAAAIEMGSLTPFWNGLKGASVAFQNHPLNSVLPFLGLESVGGTASELARNPVKSISSMAKGTAEGAAGAITSTVDLLKSPFSGRKTTSPLTDLANRITTPAKLSEAGTQTIGSIDGIINDLIKKNSDFKPVEKLTKISEEAKKTTEATEIVKKTTAEAALEVERSGLDLERSRLEFEKTKIQLEALSNFRTNTINATLNSLELQKQIGIGEKSTADVGPAMSDTLHKIADDTQTNYEKALPRVGENAYPSLKPIVSSLEDFKSKLSGGIDSNLNKVIETLKDTFTAKDRVTEFYKTSKEKPTDIELENYLNKDKYTTDKEIAKQMGWKYVDKETIKPASASLIKTTVTKQTKELLVGDRADYGKVFNETIQPAIDTILQSTVPKESGLELARLNQIYKAIKFDNSSLISKLAKANSATDIISLLSDPKIRAALENIDPVVSDVANQAMAKAILEKGKNTDGTYNADRLGKLIEENKNFVAKEDYIAIQEQVINLKEDKMKMAEQKMSIKTAEKNLRERESALTKAEIKHKKAVTAEEVSIKKANIEKQKTIGTTPTEVFKNISKIDSPEKLVDFAEKAGVEPAGVGELYVESVIAKTDPELASGVSETFNVDKLKILDEELQKFGGDGPEREFIRKQAFGKNLELVDDLHLLKEQMDALKGAKTSSPALAALKITGGVIAAKIHFVFTGARYITEGIKDLQGKNALDLNKVGERDITRTSFEKTQKVKGDGGLIKKSKKVTKAVVSKRGAAIASEAANEDLQNE